MAVPVITPRLEHDPSRGRTQTGDSFGALWLRPSCGRAPTVQGSAVGALRATTSSEGIRVAAVKSLDRGRVAGVRRRPRFVPSNRRRRPKHVARALARAHGHRGLSRPEAKRVTSDRLPRRATSPSPTSTSCMAACLVGRTELRGWGAQAVGSLSLEEQLRIGGSAYFLQTATSDSARCVELETSGQGGSSTGRDRTSRCRS